MSTVGNHICPDQLSAAGSPLTSVADEEPSGAVGRRQTLVHSAQGGGLLGMLRGATTGSRCHRVSEGRALDAFMGSWGPGSLKQIEF